MPIYEAITDAGTDKETPIQRRALGPQGFHIVKEAGRRAEELSVDVAAARREERRRRQKIVDAASVRPAPGTSEQLANVDGSHGHGKMQVEVYDLVGMMPVKLRGHRGLS